MLTILKVLGTKTFIYIKKVLKSYETEWEKLQPVANIIFNKYYASDMKKLFFFENIVCVPRNGGWDQMRINLHPWNFKIDIRICEILKSISASSDLSADEHPLYPSLHFTKKKKKIIFWRKKTIKKNVDCFKPVSLSFFF